MSSTREIVLEWAFTANPGDLLNYAVAAACDDDTWRAVLGILEDRQLELADGEAFDFTVAPKGTTHGITHLADMRS